MIHQYELLPTDAPLPYDVDLGRTPKRRASLPGLALGRFQYSHALRPFNVIYGVPAAIFFLLLLALGIHDGPAWWLPSRWSGFSLDFKDGLAFVDVDHMDGGGRHPILELIQRARDRANSVRERIRKVRGVHDAAKDYKEAFGMMPPEGFEQW